MEVNDNIDWKSEANAVIEDVKQFVSSISIAKEPESNDMSIYFDIETFEREKFIVSMRSYGFTILNPNDKNNQDSDDNQPIVYETINALLDSKSVEYRKAFANSLLTKLTSIVDDKTN